MASSAAHFVALKMLKNLKVASPCPADWNRMAGDDRVRHCAECNLNVYNFSAMTSTEVMQLIKTHEGRRLCGRFYKRRDGTILTQDCPVGFRVKVRRVSRIAGATLAAMGLAGVAAAQARSPKKPSNTQTIKATNPEIKIEVLNENKWPIPYAKVSITGQSPAVRVEGISALDGSYTAQLKPGVYVLKVEGPNLRTRRRTLAARHNETVVVTFWNQVIKTTEGKLVDMQQFQGFVVSPAVSGEPYPETIDDTPDPLERLLHSGNPFIGDSKKTPNIF